MEQLNRDGKSGFGTTIGALKPELFVKNWQQNTVRVLRAQERLMQGVAAAVRAEMRYGQELMASRFNFLKWDSSELPHAGNGASQEMEKFAAVIREVTEELRNGFTEATKLLSEGASEDVREAAQKVTNLAEAASHKAEDVGRKVEVASHKAEDAASKVEDTVEETGENVADAARKTTTQMKRGKSDEA
jgi:methyl-accepting chemotaxis protein